MTFIKEAMFDDPMKPVMPYNKGIQTAKRGGSGSPSSKPANERPLNTHNDFSEAEVLTEYTADIHIYEAHILS